MSCGWLPRPVWLEAKEAEEAWPAITAEELALKDNPAQPGAPAMILYREIRTDDTQRFERHHFRIKVFSDEGKKYADVEIPYWKSEFKLTDIRARTVRPDGTSVAFTGQIFEKTIARYKKYKYLAKTFTLPEVGVGSIIEYKYTWRWGEGWLSATSWPVQHELFTRRARFSLTPYTGLMAGPDGPSAARLTWMTNNVPRNEIRQYGVDVVLEKQNIPAFQEEQHMPPEIELKGRVDLFYSPRMLETSQQFWGRIGKDIHKNLEKFLKEDKLVRRAVPQLIAANDPPETKLRKLYARAQQVRYLSYERPKTEKEAKREKLKDNESVDDVLGRGYAYTNQINWLFLAMARAAGFQAWPVLAASRASSFFKEDKQDLSQLNAAVVAVRIGTQDYYFDPATLYTPYKLLPWEETGVKGLRLEADGGVFLTTPQPQSAEAVSERKAALALDVEGNLRGKLTITFNGHEALRRRLEARDEDEAGRRKQLEDEVKESLPAGATVELESIPAWESADELLKAEFTVEVPGLAAMTGRRLLLPLGIFETQGQHPFEHAKRVHPIYFRYPFQVVDDTTVELPAGVQVETLPAERKRGSPYGEYVISAKKEGDKLRIRRKLTIEGYYYKVEYYTGLRQFFDSVRAGDTEQAVLNVTDTSK